MKNCKAAQYNPSNACTDRCKWPGACVNGRLSIASVLETTEAFLAEETPEPVTQESLVQELAEIAETVKKKPGRPKKAS